MWEDALAAPVGDDAAVEAMRDEAAHVLPVMGKVHRILAIARSPMPARP